MFLILYLIYVSIKWCVWKLFMLHASRINICEHARGSALVSKFWYMCGNVFIGLTLCVGVCVDVYEYEYVYLKKWEI